MLVNRSMKNRLLACFAIAGISLTASSSTLAADCGCEPTCGACTTTASACTCNCSRRGPKHNCLFKAFDAVADGFEKLFHLNRSGCDEMSCDDACDAAMIDDLMVPMPPVEHRHSHHGYHAHSGHGHSGHGHSGHAHSAPTHSPPVPYNGPTRNLQLTPTGPSQWEGAGQHMVDPQETEFHMSEPRMEPSPDAGQHLGGGVIGEPEMMGTVPPPVRVEEFPNGSRLDGSQLDGSQLDGSGIDSDSGREELFDSLSDPFGDDQTQVRRYQPVRPSNYDEDYLRPISKRPLSRSESSSSRRLKSIR